jgi:hypothetical protein
MIEDQEEETPETIEIEETIGEEMTDLTLTPEVTEEIDLSQ